MKLSYKALQTLAILVEETAGVLGMCSDEDFIASELPVYEELLTWIDHELDTYKLSN